MKRTVLLSALLCITAWQSHAQNLRGEVSLSDPFILPDPVSGKYYMTGTGGGLWVSPDLEVWTGPTWPVQTTETSWMGGHPQVWASEIHYVNGTYYNISTFTNGSVKIDDAGHSRRGVHILSSSLPEGKYTLIDGGDETYAPASKCTLDGSLFTDTDGQRYLLYCHEWIQNGNGTVEAVPLRSDMKGTSGSATVLFRAKDATWNTSPVTDGPFAFRTKTGRLCIIWTSWHGERYVQGVAYSESGAMKGPWKQQALPITPDNFGHGMLFRNFDGQLLMCIHSHRTIDASIQKWERHPTLFLMDDSGDRLRTVMEYRYQVGPSRPARVMVDNPEFEYGTQGWTSTTGATNQKIASNQGGAITGNFFESWDKNSFAGEIYQQLEVPNGTYQLSAAAFRSYPADGGSNTAQTVVLFANDATTTVTATTPERFTVTTVVTDGHLRIGLRSTKKNYQWMGVDNVELRYFGPQAHSAAELEKALTQRVYFRNLRSGRWLNAGNSWGTQAILADHPLDFQLVPLPDGHFALDSRLSNGGGNHYAAANGYLDGVPTAFSITPVSDHVVTLSTDDGKHYWTASGTSLNTQLTRNDVPTAQWEMLTYDDLLDSLAQATAEHPADATFLINCPQFGRNDTRVGAWTGDFEVGGDVTNQCAQGIGQTFTVSQTLTDVPEGYYELRAQGFYRDGKAADAKAAHQDGTEQLRAQLFLNDEATPLPSIFNPRPTQSINSAPTSLSTISSRFTSGQYACSLQTYVSGGRLTFGVRKTDAASPADDWTVFDNFELYYYGKDLPTGIEQVQRTKYTEQRDDAVYDLQGRRLPCLQRGLNIVNGHKILIR